MKIAKRIFFSILVVAVIMLVLKLTKPARVRAMFKKFEMQCANSGWQLSTIQIASLSRKLMWKDSQKPWRHGAIIVLHGGGGAYSNFGAGIQLGEPMVEFTKLALSKGFAVISPNSTWDKFTDGNNKYCGKRWDCLARNNYRSIDLPFIEAIIDKTIPSIRPASSSRNVFITGISNGGFMCILAATNFPAKIKAFAPVSCGDPYGTHFDMTKSPIIFKRPHAPGFFCDNETNLPINTASAAVCSVCPNEIPWPQVGTYLPIFKQFHHQGDAGVDFSLMQKANRQLIKHGFKDYGAYIVKNKGRKSLLKHFWLSEYNEPMIEFFVGISKKEHKKN